MADLITMQKDDDTLAVHRSCVADHARVGWVVRADDAPPTPHDSDNPQAPKRGRKPKHGNEIINE